MVFDIVINLQTPFSYDPTTGRNLLLDITNREPGNNDINIFFDAVSAAGDSVSRVYSAEGAPNAAAGTAQTLGLITRFQHIPGPGALALLGAASLVVRRRRR